MSALILDNEDAENLGKDGWDILRLAQATATLGQALAFVRNGRSLREFKTWLLNERRFNRAMKPSKFCDPF
jgi:hypothetical protein